MSAESIPEVVSFITVEESVDLIVSFVIAASEDPGDVVSLVLLRTPKFEHFLSPEERGVSVSHESYPREADADLLQRIKIAPPVVAIETVRKRYDLDVSKVDHNELQSAQKVLERMNFDHRFVVELG